MPACVRILLNEVRLVPKEPNKRQPRRGGRHALRRYSHGAYRREAGNLEGGMQEKKTHTPSTFELLTYRFRSETL